MSVDHVILSAVIYAVEYSKRFIKNPHSIILSEGSKGEGFITPFLIFRTGC